MQKNDLIQTGDIVLRILTIDGDRVLAIDCLKRNMPKWYQLADLNYETFTEQELISLSDIEVFDIDSLDSATRKIVHDRYTIIAGILPFLTDEKMRSVVISRVADEHEICKQTVRNYLCLYLAFQNLSALAPKRTEYERPLSKDEKNMRWALNKFFYTKNQNSLPTAYTMMLKEKYSDEAGTLLPHFPTFNQFRYFYRKHKKLQTYYISRNGIKSYQRNNRPLTLDETIALITAANTIVQNPDSVGTTLKTVSMFLRAAKTEAEEAGESTEGMANSVSELRQEILDLTGQKVDIQIDEDTFKSTYQILKELSEVWDDLTDISQANILELIGGKRNSNVVSALMKNFSIAEDALKTSASAAGSALAENEKYLDSIQGKISQFQAAWQAFSNTVINSAVVKAIVSVGTIIIDTIDSLLNAFNGLGGVVASLSIVGFVGKLKPVAEILDYVKNTATNFAGGAK